MPRDHLKGGRNAIIHKYPAKPSNSHYAEDNGGEPNEFHLTAYLHGPTLMAQWSALKAALNTPGPGTLSHPWEGNRLVQHKGPYNVKRDDKDAGVLEIELTFFETLGGGVFPSVAGVIAASIAGLSTNAIAMALSSFASAFNLPSSPFSQAFVGSILDGMTGQIATSFGSTAGVAAAANVLSANALTNLTGGLDAIALASSLNDYGASGDFE